MTRLPRKLLTVAMLSSVAALTSCGGAAAPAARTTTANASQPAGGSAMTTDDTTPARAEVVRTAASAEIQPARLITMVTVPVPAAVATAIAAVAATRPAAGNTKNPCYEADDPASDMWSDAAAANGAMR